jgi:choline dehydrogenase-like flavoprotein
MPIDAASETHADVLIIGAGASGGVAARRLAAAGLKVVALEQGRWHDRENFRGSEWDWDLTALKQWNSIGNIRLGPDDYPIDVSQSDMEVMHFCGVGGGAVMYNGVWLRLLPENFRTRSLYGIADDWPVDYAELQPWYEEVDRQIGVSGLGGNPVYPEGAEPPMPPLPFGPGRLAVARALAARKWHWWPDSNAILSANYDGRRPYVGHGTCGQGCNEGAKSSIDYTHWRPFVAAGGTVITGAIVARITLDADGLANGAIWIDAAGTEHFQPADIVLCAANAIGTPRLLLSSACDRYPTGLANSSDQVGRRLMMHPLTAVVGLFEEQLEGWRTHNGSTVQCLQFGLHDARRGFAGGAKWSMHPVGIGPMREAMRLLQRGVPPEQHHAELARRAGHGIMWSIMCEDMPDPDNRVVLSPDLVDPVGLPAPKLIYRYSDDVRRCLTYNAERGAEILRAAGAVATEAYDPAGSNAHLMGTARMGDDPRTSVVDRWCMSHDIPNLGVIDGSVFVTSGPVNPTSTITALALRAADRLAREGGRIPRPKRGTRSTYDLARKPRPRPAPEPPPAAPDAAALARLQTIADALIPAVDDLPAAGALAISLPAVSRVLGSRPDLGRPLARALAADPTDFAALAKADREAWLAALTMIAGCYYDHPRVKHRIGYPGQTAILQQPDRTPPYADEGLLDHVLEDGWRQAWSNAG